MTVLRHKRRRPTAANRRGLAVVMVLVALAVITSLFAARLRIAAMGRHEIESQHRRAQAESLAQSGLERAAARLNDDATYSGERWTLPASELPGDRPAAVSIAVETDAADARRRVVTVEADYPDEKHDRCRVVRRVVVALSRPETTQNGENP